MNVENIVANLDSGEVESQFLDLPPEKQEEIIKTAIDFFPEMERKYRLTQVKRTGQKAVWMAYTVPTTSEVMALPEKLRDFLYRQVRTDSQTAGRGQLFPVDKGSSAKPSAGKKFFNVEEDEG